ncbi:Acetyl esterase/lipase [Lutibacter oricola]|uniref:Acetyl esterase/lipase n=1 Tax=Lutibacter oricola TaxID=762486 RepID=A0A1H3FH10_9FLAO|nr:alpha/beta hydrolase [Lutibacter oricola]SDX90135.1 Acetyl esterase/lipase [Lutibacter oricola]
MTKYFILVATMCFTLVGNAQNKTIPLWKKNIPDQKKSSEKEIIEETNIIRISNVQKPTIDIYLASKKLNTKKSVLICPGGGYGILAWNHEGTNFAKWFASKGINAFVLKYRLPGSKSLTKPHLAPLQDAQRAIRIIRKNAKKWKLDENQIGVMGFSAGGHLASTLGTHYNFEAYKKQDKIDKLSAKPNFMGLIYPVISMQDGVTHKGSKKNLLGKTPSKKMVDLFSNELQITEETSPTFLVHSTNDKAVPVKNTMLFFEALLQKNIKTEMHIYPLGGHGYAFAKDMKQLEQWPELFYNWLMNLE